MLANDRAGRVSRRAFLAGSVALGGLLATGCRLSGSNGFSAEGLARLRAGLERYIENDPSEFQAGAYRALA